MGMAYFEIKSITEDERKKKTVVVEINQFSILEIDTAVQKFFNEGADEITIGDVDDDKIIFRMYCAKPKEELPSSVDLRDQCPPVVDQGEFGSSTACATAAAIEAINAKTNEIREQ